MNDLSIDEKAAYAAHRAKEVAAEKHFYDLHRPHFPLGFSVGYRNPGHWDVYAQRAHGRPEAFMYANPGGFTSDKDPSRERAFAIRGEPGRVIVRDERWNPHRKFGDVFPPFRSVMAAMLWIMEELMQEPPSNPPKQGAHP